MDKNTLKDHGLAVYASLSRIPKLSYRGKILLVTFLGIHVPLISLGFYISFSVNVAFSEVWLILLVALIATLAGTAISLLALNHLLRPIMLAGQAMHDYISNRKPVNLPVHYKDAAGQLMADTVYTLQTLDENVANMTRVDPVTGLLNRKGLLKKLGVNTETSQRYIVVLLIKNWEKILSTDSKVAQKLVRETARVLKLNSPENGLVARIAEDKFTLAFPDGLICDEVYNTIKLIIEKIESTRIVGYSLPQISVSAGIACCPDDANNNELALALAGSAVNDEAISFFSADRHEILREHYDIELAFSNAIEREQFEIWYQPVVNFNTKEITSFEALCRWRHPEKGIVMPDKFIHVAEQCGFIHKLGDWLFSEVCRQWSVLKSNNPNLPRVAINISPIQLNKSLFAVKMLDCMRDNNLGVEDLELEITESTAMSNRPETQENLKQFADAGFLISIDDFGTGFSNLSRINALAVSRVKIDRQFICDLANNPQNQIICKSIHSLAVGLGLKITGEGVESESEAFELKEIGCVEQQGFWYSHPLPFSEISAYLGKMLYDNARLN